ncbi:hypothetical protein FSARC_6522 [Fusarium sarcochroum]|uniref:Heterokaryon incompatibility domain-containing protein n=1 Tax=Fusarium sarcochroum TaxID=1208366 RepID=A0A8H4TXK4_9HYPO|nr:hypothetical protein FSARC_6522 [Fusarium sarcochroum]
MDILSNTSSSSGTDEDEVHLAFEAPRAQMPQWVPPATWDFTYRHPSDQGGGVSRRTTSDERRKNPFPWNFGRVDSDSGEEEEDSQEDDDLFQDGPPQIPDPAKDYIQLNLDDEPPPCLVCQWSGHLQDILHRRYLLDKNHSAKYPELKERESSCASCSIVVKCLQHIGHGKDDTTIQFLTSHLEPAGTFFKIVGDTSPPPQIFSRKDEIDYDSIKARIGAPRFVALNRDTSSPESIHFAHNSLINCWDAHKTCRPSDSGFLPTRLIDIKCRKKDDDYVILVNTKHLEAAKARYIALSHRWGKTLLRCCTTPENYSAHMKGIPLASMPDTFRDAVKMARNLGFHYLWIDSLCIIQQDPQDWRHESGKMFDVYANSVLTLAAVHAEDSNGGLFAQAPQISDSGRSPFAAFEYRVVFDEEELKLRKEEFGDQETTQSRLQSLHVRRCLPRFHSWKHHDLPERSALFTRAWAYQERLVSPRVLYFTENELLWECFEGSSCECSGDDRELGPKQNHQAAVTNSDCHDRWRDIVSEYSRLDLTMERDKLPAVSAIAVQIQRTRSKADYVAGLWSDSLVRDLLWRAQVPSRGRPVSKIAPSWTWASVKSGVEYPTSNVRYLDILGGILDVKVNYPGVDKPESPHAASVVAGTITLRAPVVEFKVITNEAGPSQWRLKHEESQASFRFFHDADNDLVDGTEPLYGVAIAKSKPNMMKAFHGLVLRSDAQTGKYSRVGVLTSMSIMPSKKDLAIKKMFEEFGKQEDVVIE